MVPLMVQVSSTAKVDPVPETFYFPTWTASERWAHAEQTVRERWTKFSVHLWTVNGEWTQSANGAQARVQIERWTHGERYVNAMWTQDEWFILNASGVILYHYTLYIVGSQVKNNQ